MGLRRVLIANRGEIAIRVARSVAELGLASVAVCSEDDAESLHAARADVVEALPGRGAAAYLDQEGVLAAAERARCDAIHPGYGFLSENAGFARACAERGITFVGPASETLELFGDKARARAFAKRCGVPVLPGPSSPPAHATISAVDRAMTAARNGVGSCVIPTTCVADGPPANFVAVAMNGRPPDRAP